MTDPPSNTGGVNATWTEASPGVAVTFVGESGMVYGVTAVEVAEVSPTPATLIAATENV
jgi:hypothetical protein